MTSVMYWFTYRPRASNRYLLKGRLTDFYEDTCRLNGSSMVCYGEPYMSRYLSVLFSILSLNIYPYILSINLPVCLSAIFLIIQLNVSMQNLYFSVYISLSQYCLLYFCLNINAIYISSKDVALSIHSSNYLSIC